MTHYIESKNTHDFFYATANGILIEKNRETTQTCLKSDMISSQNKSIVDKTLIAGKKTL